jgi:type VI secretion system secreted protein Hcp
MAFDTFLQIDTVQGESTDEKHKNWISVFSFSHGISQSGAGSISSQGARTAGKVDHQDFHFTKRLDKSSPFLHKHCCTGKHFPKVVVEICKNTGNKEVIYKYTMEHALVSSIQTGGGEGQEHPVESVALQYGKIKWEMTPIDPKTGAKGGTVAAEWDVMANKGA